MRRYLEDLLRAEFHRIWLYNILAISGLLFGSVIAAIDSEFIKIGIGFGVASFIMAAIGIYRYEKHINSILRSHDESVRQLESLERQIYLQQLTFAMEMKRLGHAPTEYLQQQVRSGWIAQSVMDNILAAIEMLPDT